MQVRYLIAFLQKFDPSAQVELEVPFDNVAAGDRFQVDEVKETFYSSEPNKKVVVIKSSDLHL